jgi:hypothetical protein
MGCTQYVASLLLLATLGACGEPCQGQAVCEDVSTEAAQASAMLQVGAEPHTFMAKLSSERSCAPPTLEDAHLKETAGCLPDGLQESHLQAVRRHAALLVSGAKPSSSASQPATSGATASLDAAGFKDTTSLCCPMETEQFFNRLLESKGFDVCSKPHVQGLMHWFSCVPDMDFQYVLDVINEGNPCKYWAPKGTTCPALSAKCDVKWCR